MPGYYVYVMSHGGHVEKRFDLFCENDEQAKERAKQLMDGHSLELWQEKRRIAEFKPKGLRLFNQTARHTGRIRLRP